MPDTEDKRRSVIHVLPIPDGIAPSEADRKQVAWIYNGLPFTEPKELTLRLRELGLTLQSDRNLSLTLPFRPMNLTLPESGTIMSKRKMEQSPVEIGMEEIVPHTLTVPSSWGTATNPSGAVKTQPGGEIVSGAISGISVTSNVIPFILTGSVLTINNDYRIEIKFDVSGGTLEAWGIWSARL